MPVIHIHYPDDLPATRLHEALLVLDVTPRLNADGDLIARTRAGWAAQDQLQPQWPQGRAQAINTPDSAARIRAAMRGGRS